MSAGTARSVRLSAARSVAGLRLLFLMSALLCVLVGLPAGAAPKPAPIPSDDALLRQGVVLVDVSPVVSDPLRPWVTEAGAKFTILGVVVDGNRILTTAGDIRSAGLVEVRKFSSYNKAQARVIRLDLESNLALLTVAGPSFFADLRPLPLGGEPAPDEELVAARIDEVFRVHRERAGIRGMEAINDFGLTHLPTIQLAVNSSFRAGGLLLRGRELAGFIGYGEAENRAEALPGPFVKDFLAQSGRGGFPAAGFGLVGLVDPVVREHYGLLADQSGALVSRVFPGTAALGVIQAEDVVLAVDGVALDARGFYEDTRWGRQTGLLLFSRRADGTVRSEGGSVRVDLVRAKERLSVSVPLRAYAGGAERIPWVAADRPAYLMEGGFVFLELSVPLMRRRFGNAWRAGAGEASYLFASRRFRTTPGDDRLLVLSEVLPDPENRGYHNLSFVLIESVDGHMPGNLSELHRYIEKKAQEGAARLLVRLAGGVPVYIPLRDRVELARRILKRYGLPHKSSFEVGAAPAGAGVYSKK